MSFFRSRTSFLELEESLYLFTSLKKCVIQMCTEVENLEEKCLFILKIYVLMLEYTL